MESKELDTVPTESSQSMTVQSIHRQIQLIQEVMKSEMKSGEHYGVIPGTGSKPSLLKAGAEKLSLLFKMAPRFKVEHVDLGNGHREVRIVTELYHIVTNNFLGEGLGSCSTLETKYRYRNNSKICPSCEGAFIIKGKTEYGGGWVCFAKKGGCGAKFKEGDPVIESQDTGKVENSDIADTYNTVLKMGKKRSLVDAVLTATAASDIFTQDVEDMVAETPPVAKAASIPEPTRTSQADGGEVYDVPPEDVVDDTPYDDAPEPAPKKAEAPKAAPVGATMPADRQRMQSTFEGSICKDPACKGKIRKGDWIWKSPHGWAHEVHHA